MEKECLAIKLAIQHLFVYLLGRKFRVQTDHRALQWLTRAKETNARLLRWSLALQLYDFIVEHRKGKDNANADTLSRMVLRTGEGGRSVAERQRLRSNSRATKWTNEGRGQESCYHGNLTVNKKTIKRVPSARFGESESHTSLGSVGWKEFKEEHRWSRVELVTIDINYHYHLMLIIYLLKLFVTTLR